MNYVQINNPNGSIQVGRTGTKFYKGFMKDPEYIENFANVYKNMNLKKLRSREYNAFVSNMKHNFYKLSNQSQKKIIKNFMMKYLNEDTIYHNLLNVRDQNSINNKGNEYILSKNYKSNIINLFLNYPYSSQQRSWNKLLDNKKSARNMERKHTERQHHTAMLTPLPN